jgi:AcrR family transcriptional regulator
MARLRRAEQVAQNRGLVLDTARRVFVERGYAGASIDAIAAEAGFSIGVVYSQFGSKADLFFALLDRRIEDRAQQNARIADVLTGAAGLRALMKAGRADDEAEPGWQFLLAEFRSIAMRDAALNQRYAQAHARTIDGIAETIRKLYESTDLVPPVAVRSLAELLQAGTVGVALERAANPHAIPDGDVERVVLLAFGFGD